MHVTNVLTWQFLVNEKHHQINSVPASHGPKRSAQKHRPQFSHYKAKYMLITRQQLHQPCNVCEMLLSKDSEPQQATTLAALVT